MMSGHQPSSASDDFQEPPPLINCKHEIKRHAAQKYQHHLENLVQQKLADIAAPRTKKFDSFTLLDDSPKPDNRPFSTKQGLKPGFLLNQKSKSIAKQSITNQQPKFDVKKSTAAEYPLILPQVQKAMQDPKFFLTPNLMNTIDKNPTLASAFEDPGFMQFIDCVKSDPKLAQYKYNPANNPRYKVYWNTMKQLTGLIGHELENRV